MLYTLRLFLVFLSIFTIYGIDLGYAFGQGSLLGNGVFGGKGARYTNVVSRGAVATPYYRPSQLTPLFPSQPIYDRPSRIGISAGDPFQGNRAAVSGAIVGVAPSIQPINKSYQHSYESHGSLLGESLGLIPVTRPRIGLDGGFGSNDAPIISAPSFPYGGVAGFPRFEPDGYIVHDQRGRDSSTCPIGGCPPPGEMSPDMQAMYNKYKRYYRNYGPGSRQIAPAPTGRLSDPVDFLEYNRQPSGSAHNGEYFSASPLADRRAIGSLGEIAPGTPASGARMAIGGEPIGVDGSRSRNSFFGKIYDSPSRPAPIGGDFEESVLYEAPARASYDRPLGEVAAGSGRITAGGLLDGRPGIGGGQLLANAGLGDLGDMGDILGH